MSQKQVQPLSGNEESEADIDQAADIFTDFSDATGARDVEGETSNDDIQEPERFIATIEPAEALDIFTDTSARPDVNEEETSSGENTEPLPAVGAAISAEPLADARPRSVELSGVDASFAAESSAGVRRRFVDLVNDNGGHQESPFANDHSALPSLLDVEPIRYPQSDTTTSSSPSAISGDGGIRCSPERKRKLLKAKQLEAAQRGSDFYVIVAIGFIILLTTFAIMGSIHLCEDNLPARYTSLAIIIVIATGVLYLGYRRSRNSRRLTQERRPLEVRKHESSLESIEE